jgi:molybdate transport repressor ModE-like protein
MRIKIKPSLYLQPHPSRNGVKDQIDLSYMASILLAIREHGSSSEAADVLGITYRTLLNHLKIAESAVGSKLVSSINGQGSSLTPAGHYIVSKIDELDKQLLAMTPNTAHEIQSQLEKFKQIRHHKIVCCTSSDPLIEKLQSLSDRFEFRTMGSGQALEQLFEGKADIAGFHITEGNIYSVHQELKRKNIITYPIMRRVQGLMFLKGNPLKIKSVHDLTKPKVRFMNRQKGAGTRLLLDQLLEKERINPKQIQGYQNEEFTHNAVATAILAQVADVGLGLQYVADQYGLDFVEVATETFFFAMKPNLIKNSTYSRLIKNIRKLASENSGYLKLNLRKVK